MPRPRKPYHLLSESGKRKRDKEEEQESKKKEKREKKRVYMERFRASKAVMMVKEQEKIMASSSIGSSNDNNKINANNENIRINPHPNVASLKSNIRNDHTFSTPIRDTSAVSRRIGSSVQTPIEVLQARLDESHYLRSIIEESAKKRIEESKLQEEFVVRESKIREGESKIREVESTKRQQIVEDESRKRQKFVDDAEHELKSASYARDEILKELLEQMKQQENKPNPSAVIIYQTPINMDNSNRSPPDENMLDIAVASNDDNFSDGPTRQLHTHSSVGGGAPFSSFAKPNSSSFFSNSELRFNIGSAGPSNKRKKHGKGKVIKRSK